MNFLFDALWTVAALGTVVALIVVLPFLLMWFFRRVSIGTPKEGLNTIRKIR